ncbi:gliding motility-associated C-terminal domain-containing protein [Chitinophaga sedimenti]|uniref:gliding motility-associated C-terminal domain-containing protein n=1 Tax=Chitinophaga sedimenti TaxID=2033606 RepID=UPI00200459DE|nr:gliding motility-associated C-terminal domain-containing protein [Chitinophaga sedimenti]MCK7558327.1 gliding motility-associated C-terminal domain-containing protein [Chitinophaga sedimenti]
MTVRAIGLTPCSNSGWFLGASGTSDNPNGNVVFIPNAFTPNNDGSNDILYVYGNTIAKMSLRIFNQWGQLVFESKDKAKGWDGTMSGQRQPVGVYVYEFMSTMTDGTKINKRGTITIIR